MMDRAFDAPLRELYRLFFSIEQAVAYISAEILNLETGPETRASVQEMCARFRDILYDVRQEIDALVDIMMVSAPSGMEDDAAVSPGGPRAPLRLIDQWLRDGV